MTNHKRMGRSQQNNIVMLYFNGRVGNIAILGVVGAFEGHKVNGKGQTLRQLVKISKLKKHVTFFGKKHILKIYT